MYFLPAPVKTKSTSIYKNENYYVCCSSMQGWRRNNEDAFAVTLQTPDEGGCAYFGLFDGHGGQSSATFASKHLFNTIRSQPEYLEGDIKRGIQQGFLTMDYRMRSNADVNREQSGCTACTVLIKDSHIYCGNAGDSGAIGVLKNGSVHMCREHRPTEPDEHARIIAAGRKVINNRIDGLLAVSRGFGDYGFKNNIRLPPSAQACSCLPEVRDWTLNDSWRAIVLACDGILEVFSPAELAEFVKNQIESMRNPKKIVEDLLENCCSRTGSGPGCDNMTVILVLIRKNLPLAYKLALIDLETLRRKRKCKVQGQGRLENPCPLGRKILRTKKTSIISRKKTIIK